MEIIGREALAMVLQLPTGRTDRLALYMHFSLSGSATALLQIAWGAGGRDIFPAGPPALRAGHDMVEGQLAMTAAVNAPEAVAEEQIESGEGRIFIGPHELPKRDYRREFHRSRWAVHFPVIMGDDIDPLEEHRLDRGLPRPQRQRVVAERSIIGIEHQRGTRVRMAKEVGMVHGAKFSSVRPANERRASGLVALSRRLPGRGTLAGDRRPKSPSFRLRPRMPTRSDDGMTPQVANHRQESPRSPLAWSES